MFNGLSLPKTFKSDSYFIQMEHAYMARQTTRDVSEEVSLEKTKLGK